MKRILPYMAMSISFIFSCKTGEEKRVERLREQTNKSVVTPEQARQIIDSINRADSLAHKK